MILKNFHRFLVVFMIFWLLSSTGFAFFDTKYSFYKQEIERFKDDGLIQGYSDGSFRPQDTISREEILKIVFQVSEKEIDETLTDCYPDIHDSMWSQKYICTGSKLGMVKWFEDGKFKPYEKVTFLEAIAFGMRAFEFEVPESGTLWYEKYRDFLDEKHIFPKQNYTKETLITRGQAVELFSRMKQYKEWSTLNYLSKWCSITNKINNTGKIIVNGTERSYILKLPTNFKTKTPYSLIFGIHGRTNSNTEVASYMWMERYPEGAIAVYPAGLGNGPYTWHQEENIDFFDALVQYFSENYCIKKDEIFVVWHSLGGYFTYKLAGLRWDMIRAISVVWGAGFWEKLKFSVATQILHRPDDKLVSIKDGEWMQQQFQKINLCDTKNTTSQSYGGITYTKNTCSWENPVLFAKNFSTFQNDPHSWPVDGRKSIFEFFQSLTK